MTDNVDGSQDGSGDQAENPSGEPPAPGKLHVWLENTEPVPVEAIGIYLLALSDFNRRRTGGTLQLKLESLRQGSILMVITAGIGGVIATVAAVNGLFELVQNIDRTRKLWKVVHHHSDNEIEFGRAHQRLLRASVRTITYSATDAHGRTITTRVTEQDFEFSGYSANEVQSGQLRDLDDDDI